jgi:hypothetical protein
MTDRPLGLAIGNRKRITQGYFDYGSHKALLKQRWIAIPRSCDGTAQSERGAAAPYSHSICSNTRPAFFVASSS